MNNKKRNRNRSHKTAKEKKKKETGKVERSQRNKINYG